MAKEYNVGSRLYLPVWVTEKETNLMMGPDKSTTITDAKFSYAYWHGKTGEGKVRYGEPGLLLTTEEVAEEYKDKATRRIQLLEKENATYRETISNRVEENEELDGENKELKSRNAELEALLNEVMATRDEAIRQNNELIAENSKMKADCNEWKDAVDKRIVDVQNLTAERDNLKAELDQRNKDFWAMKKDRDELDSIGGKLRAENDKLKAWYEEANKTATEAAEANDELKTKIADLRNRVGEQLAQIQDLSAEAHFLKEERDLKAKLAQEWHDNAHSTAKGLDELKGRYDELDSVNKEQAEKIRKLDKALTDLKKRNDDLQAENTNLTFLLEDAPEKETTKTLHVVLNDGTEIEFRRYTAYDYRTDINMFVVKDGEKYIAGFLRGDKPMNLAYWWTE